ncbi:MAG: hypothetical protein PS018_21865 [bacterium]|nr:hypothetical protein [bacterium]
MSEAGIGSEAGTVGRNPFDSGVYAGQQGGLLGRLQALQVEQSRYQPIPSSGHRGAPVAEGPDFRELSRVRSGALPFTVNSPASSQSIRQFEAGQAQEASEAAAARLSRGVRSSVRLQAPEPDPIDIAKSAGIGVVHGAVNTAGLLGEIPTGFGLLPKNQLANTWFRATGQSEFSPDGPDWIRERATADAFRQGIEKLIPWQF